MQFLIEHWFWAVSALVSGGLLAWSAWGRQRGGRWVDTLGATRLINQGALVLDVRGAPDFAAGHLVDSRNIPAPDVGRRADELPAQKVVLVVCETGRSATQAAAALRRAGRADIYCLEGGLQAWRQAGLPVLAGARL